MKSNSEHELRMLKMKISEVLRWFLIVISILGCSNVGTKPETGQRENHLKMQGESDAALSDSCFWDCMMVTKVTSTSKKGVREFFGLYFDSKSCGEEFITRLDGKLGERQHLKTYYEPVWHVQKLDGLSEDELFIECVMDDFPVPNSNLRYDHIKLYVFDNMKEPVLQSEADAKLYAEYFQGVLDDLGCHPKGRGTD